MSKEQSDKRGEVESPWHIEAGKDKAWGHNIAICYGEGGGRYCVMHAWETPERRATFEHIVALHNSALSHARQSEDEAVIRADAALAVEEFLRDTHAPQWTSRLQNLLGHILDRAFAPSTTPLFTPIPLLPIATGPYTAWLLERGSPAEWVNAAKDGCVGAVWTRDSTMAQQFRTKTEAENYAECYHIDDATATDHMFNCGISTAPSPLGGLAEVLAFYDELVDGPDPLDHQDAEADFVMRGSDWRTIRPAVCMPSATRRSDPLPEGWGWVPCTPKLLERHPSGCFMFIRRPGDQHHSHDHFVPPETLEVMNRADGGKQTT